MRHVRQESRLDFVGTTQVIRALVQLRVQRDDAAVRVLQLAVEPHQLLLPCIEIVERPEELLILLLDLLDRARRSLGRERFGELRDVLGGEERESARQEFLQRDDRPCRARFDREMIHEPPCADDAEAHTGARSIPPREDLGELRNA